MPFSRHVLALAIVGAVVGVGGHATAQKPQLKTPVVPISPNAAGQNAIQNLRKAQIAEEEKALRTSADRVRPALAQAIAKSGYDSKGLDQRIASCQKLPTPEAQAPCFKEITRTEKLKIPAVYKNTGLDVGKERSLLATSLKLPAAVSSVSKKPPFPDQAPDDGSTMGYSDDVPLLPIAPVFPSATRDVKLPPFGILPSEGGADNNGRKMGTSSGAGGASAWYSRASITAQTNVNLNMSRVQTRARFKFRHGLMVVVGLFGYASGEIKVTLRVKRNGVEVCSRERSLDHLFAPIFAVYDHSTMGQSEGDETEMSCAVDHDNRFPQYTAQLDLEVWTGAGGLGFVTAGGIIDPISFTFESTATR